MKILNTQRIANKKLSEIDEIVSDQIKKAIKEVHSSRKINDEDITAIPFTISKTDYNCGGDAETVCIGLIISYNKAAAVSYFKSLPQSPEYVIDKKLAANAASDDLADQPVDFLDDDPQENTIYESKQETIDETIDEAIAVIKGYLEYGDLKDNLHLLTTKNILEAKKQELNYSRKEKVIDIKDIPDMDLRSKPIKQDKDLAAQGTMDDEIVTIPCDPNHSPFTKIFEHTQRLQDNNILIDLKVGVNHINQEVTKV